MNAKMNAIAMTLLMIASALAGCTSGDPDGDGTSGIDMEILNQMIDDNLQDFINNTSVTINQEIHYHNNTTSNYQFPASDMTNNSGYRGQALFSVDYEFTITVNTSLPLDNLIYEIEVPDGMGIFCINHGSNGNPPPQAYRNSTHFGEDPESSTDPSMESWERPIPPSLFFDEVPWTCASSFNGGSGGKIMQLTMPNSFENYGWSDWDADGNYAWRHHENGDVVSFRLVWTYMLVPVISDTDGGVQ